MQEELERIDAQIARWEARLAAGESLALEPALAAEGKKSVPLADADLLEAFKVLVKGDPSWNAIRDNLRELVYYRNCLATGRADALPAVPEKMALRLARHVYLYVRTRCIREGRVAP